MMGKKIFFSVLQVMMMGAAAYAQVSLSGKITHAQTGEPLTGANITLQNGLRGTASRMDGTYELQNLKEGKTVLRITFLGFKPVFDTLMLNKGKNQRDYVLTPVESQLAPLEVIALRAGETDPFLPTNLSEEDIRKQNFGKDLPILLDQTASTVTFSDAGNGVGYTGLRIRGADITRINVTLDGIPVNDPESQAVFWVNTPDLASSVQDIQIQRGAGASTNGAGNFGASVNLSTNRFNPKPYVDMAASYGSFNTLKTTLNAGSGLIGKKFTFDARASRIVSDGYIDRAKSNLQSFFVSGAYWGKKTTIRFNAFTGKEKTYQSWNGLPEYLLEENRTFNISGTEKPGEPYANETDNYRQDYYRAFITHEFNDSWSVNGAVFLTRGKGYYENYRADDRLSRYGLEPVIIGNDTLTRSDMVRQLWLDNYFYGTTLAAQYNGKKIKITLGGAYTSYDARHYGKIVWAQVGLPVPEHTFYNLSAFKNDGNLYAKINWEVANNLHLYGDIQYRYVDYKLNGFRNSPELFKRETFHFINPKAGLTYLINGKDKVFASAAVANKEPNRDDFEVAGATPVHETLYDVEAGYARKTKRYSIEANAFFMYYRNQLILTGKINDVGAYTRTNVPVSYRSGIELQGAVKFLKMVTLQANIALSTNKIKSFTEFIDNYDTFEQESIEHKNTDIAFSPNLIAGATLSVNPVQGLHMDLITKFVGRQYMDNTQNKARSLNPFSVTDVKIRYEIALKPLKNLGIFVNLHNIANAKYAPNGYTFSYIYEGEPITENFYFPQARFHWSTGIQISF
ncbi:MAG: TonB-dependent receptor [Flavobacteriales bacterium]|nr:TonB-dependent receptor [Flavobacteriales bacterium]